MTDPSQDAKHRESIAIDVQIMPDPGDVVFNDQGTPILTFEEHRPDYGSGWVLYYLDETGNGVEEYFIGGPITEI